MALGPGRRKRRLGVPLPVTANGPNPWYTWVPSWLSGLSGPVAIGAAAVGYVTWRRSGFTTRNRATIDRRMTAIRIEIANTGRMDAAIDSIRLWSRSRDGVREAPIMAPPPQSQRHGGGVIEGIYVLELGKPLREWVPLALPPGRTLQATLAAGLPTPGPARPGPPQLPPLGADPKRHLIEESVPGVTVWIVASRGPGRPGSHIRCRPVMAWLPNDVPACLPGPCRGVARKRCDA